MEAMLANFRRQRAQLPPLTNLYPYAMGRIEGVLDDRTMRPAVKLKMIRNIIAALDTVEAEPKPATDPRPYRSACRCGCHTAPGMMHVVACCIPDPKGPSE